MHGLKITAIAAVCASMVVAVPTHKNEDSCGHSSFCNNDKDRCDPPKDRDCGKWYWHKKFKYCVPSSPTYGDAGCSDGWKWDDEDDSCVPTYSRPTPPGQCNSSHFWWKSKSTCLPYGGDSKPSNPPNGWNCPKKWYWHSHGHCAPRKPDYGSPECDRKYGWDNDDLCCKPNRY
ncbi:hypothetical protein RHS03_08463, partial [Rhizoctonia solani]